MLGISGVSSDMRRLHEATPSPETSLAIRMFCYSAHKQIAGMIAAIDGVDTLDFTGGIGENDAVVRAAICERLDWIGITLGSERNLVAVNPINDRFSRCSVLMRPSQEDEEIARITVAVSERSP